jgi:hypothetical protein
MARKTPAPSSTPPPPAPSGQPRWAYALTAIVAAVGVAWAMVSHFIPKAGTAASANTTITVKGNGNLTTQNINGGEIHIGQPPAASASVPAVQAVKPTP